MNEYLALALGVVCAAVGGELFVRGVVGLASWMRVPAGIVASTVAAFATSSPELAVAITASLSGAPNIALGDALGSNVVNVALILGLALLVTATVGVPRGGARRDFSVAIIAPAVTGAMILDGRMSRSDGVVLLVVFLVWLAAALLEARKSRSGADEAIGARRGYATVSTCLAGLTLLVAAGRLVVTSAEAIAPALGLDYFVVGATVVAVATGTPEIAVTIVAAVRGHGEVGLGTILGSNVFNGLFVVGVATVLTPFPVVTREVAVSLAFGLVAVAATLPRRDGSIGRRRGVLLLALYASYVVAILRLAS